MEEYSWAITQTVRLSCCGRSGSCVLGFSFQLRSPLRARSIFNVYTQLLIAPELWNVIIAKGKSAHSWRRYIGDGGKSKYFTNKKNVSQTSMLNKGGAIPTLGGAISILGGAILILRCAILILGGAIPVLGGAILSLISFSM